MPAENDGTLSTEAQIIRDETVAKANTATRIGEHLLNMISSKVNWTQVDTDVTLAGNFDTRVASQKAIKTYADARAGTKSYRVFMSQFSTGAPTVQVIANSMGVTPTLARTSTGIYTITATGLFTTGKTFSQNNYRLIATTAGNIATIFIEFPDANTVRITTKAGALGSEVVADGVMSNTDIDITVFP